MLSEHKKIIFVNLTYHPPNTSCSINSHSPQFLPQKLNYTKHNFSIGERKTTVRPTQAFLYQGISFVEIARTCWRHLSWCHVMTEMQLHSPSLHQAAPPSSFTSDGLFHTNHRNRIRTVLRGSPPFPTRS